jgi:hypothetical protein
MSFGTQEIEASWDTLSIQAKEQASEFFNRAHVILEKSELKFTASDVIALAQTMMYDWRTSTMGVSAQKIRDAIHEHARQLSEGMVDASPSELMLDDRIQGIADAIKAIAVAIANRD